MRAILGYLPRGDRLLAAICAGVALVCAIGLPLARVHVSGLGRVVAVTVLFGGLVVYYAWRREPKLLGLVRMALWGMIISKLVDACLYLCARLPVSCSDHALARVDATFGLSTADVVRFAHTHAAIGNALALAYSSIAVFCGTVLILLPLLAKPRVGHQLLFSLLVAMGVTLVTFAALRAVGPWTAEGLTPDEGQQACEAVLGAFGAGRDVALDVNQTAGLVAIPSWHTILAVLGACACWRTRFARHPIAIWAALIVVSTLTTGWHYVIDVVAGLAVAGLTWFAVGKFLDRRGDAWSEVNAASVPSKAA